MILAAISVGVLAIVAVTALTLVVEHHWLDRAVSQIFIMFGAAAVYLAAKSGTFEQYVIAFAILRFVLLMWDVLEAASLSLVAGAQRRR